MVKLSKYWTGERIDALAKSRDENDIVGQIKRKDTPHGVMADHFQSRSAKVRGAVRGHKNTRASIILKMDKKAALKETYHSAFEDELEKIAKDNEPKTYAGVGAKLGLASAVGAEAAGWAPFFTTMALAKDKSRYKKALKQIRIYKGIGGRVATGVAAATAIGSLMKRKKSEK